MALMVYMTASSLEEAHRIAEDLVERRLAAGVNILPFVASVYRWKGAVRKASEVALLAQTSEDRFEALVARVCSLHSYETPCIVALPMLHANAAFLDWIDAETQSFYENDR
ncbi:MAG: divalent-cation tolerance protein CutA [Bilophila sp.]